MIDFFITQIVADMKSLDALRQQNLSSSGSSLNCAAIANNLPYDFIFCVGDDRDDEDMFSTIHEIVNEAKSKGKSTLFSRYFRQPISIQRERQLIYNIDSENPIHCYCTTVGKKMSQVLKFEINLRSVYLGLFLPRIRHSSRPTTGWIRARRCGDCFCHSPAVILSSASVVSSFLADEQVHFRKGQRKL